MLQNFHVLLSVGPPFSTGVEPVYRYGRIGHWRRQRTIKLRGMVPDTHLGEMPIF